MEPNKITWMQAISIWWSYGWRAGVTIGVFIGIVSAVTNRLAPELAPLVGLLLSLLRLPVEVLIFKQILEMPRRDMVIRVDKIEQGIGLPKIQAY